MARKGLFALVCAGLLFGAFSTPFSAVCAGPDDGDTSVAAALAVQTALQHGRDLVVRGNYQTAVHVLEAQLPKINGNREYLAVLREAYRGYVKELRLAKQEAQADIYSRRLLILDPGVTLDQPPAPKATPPAPAAPAPTRTVAEEPAKPKIRLKSEDPFQPENRKTHTEAQLIRDRAEQEFAARRYEEAGRLFEQANRTDRDIIGDSRDRWAYCKLYAVVQHLNKSGTSPNAYPALEREVRQAMSLAPRLDDFGKGLLRRIQERQEAATAPAPDEQLPPVAVRHLARMPEGWEVAETANFRILHNQSREVVEKAAQVAEHSRTQMYRKWFGEDGEPWAPKCDLYLHISGNEYARLTGVPANSPGHSEIRSEAGRVLARRVHVHCDDPNTFIAVLPHETTHVVLAGKFGEQPVPRWADEGMAVLTEPRDKIDRHLRNLPRHRQERQLFGVRELMEQTYPQPQRDQYPEPHRVGAFYAQSVAVVDYLTNLKGPQTFARFLRDGMRGGYETALQRHYGLQDFSDLEQRWYAHAFGRGAASGGLAQQTP